MSATGIDVFDHTIHTTNIWLGEISERIGPDRKLAWKVLTTVLQALRDQLQPDLAAHLSAQLPLLVRGGYYDHYEPAGQPSDVSSGEEFLERVAGGLTATRGVDPKDAVATVFAVLDKHISPGEAEKIRNALRKSIRALWTREAKA